jgi:methyl-accepting chemotaxis protein
MTLKIKVLKSDNITQGLTGPADRKRNTAPIEQTPRGAQMMKASEFFTAGGKDVKIDKGEKGKGINIHSTKWKFIIPVVISILVILGISGCFKYVRNSHALQAELDKKVTALFEIASLALVDPIWNINKEVIKENAESLLKNQEIGAVEVLDGDGNMLYGRAKQDTIYEKENLLPAKKQDLTKNNQKIGTVVVHPTGYFVKQSLLKDVMSIIIEITIMVVMLGTIVSFISVRLSRPIVQMAAILKDIAEGEGDLTKTIPVNGNDEIGEMALYLNRFIEKLNGIVFNIRAHSGTITSGTEELKERMAQIGRTEDLLLDTAGTTSAAVEQMAGNVTAIAESTHHLSSTADETEHLATEGRKAVQGTIDGINKVRSVLEEGAVEVKSLGNRTSEIGKVTTVINDIADQTNLLALNAAIESARAGEHGRGFAVVADEVRKLAERTTESTKEITKMISAIQQETGSVIHRIEEANSEVAHGVSLADSTGGVLDRIVGRVGDLKQMVNMLANSASEQSQATSDISNQALRVNESAKETGKAVSRGAASASEIGEVCERLNEIVGMFKLRSRDAG